MKKDIKLIRPTTATEIILVLVIISVFAAIVAPLYFYPTKNYRIAEQQTVALETYAAMVAYVGEQGNDDLNSVWVYENEQFEKRYAISQSDIADKVEGNIDLYHYDEEKGYFVGDCVVRSRIDENGNITEHRVFSQSRNVTTRILPGQDPQYKDGNKLKTEW